jgi:hypothetical protein
VTKLWQVKTGTIDNFGIEADSPMEAATQVFEKLYNKSKEFSEEPSGLYNVGVITECIDVHGYKKDPDNNTFYVLTSKVFANAGLHNFCKNMEEMEELEDEEEGL